MTQDIILRSSDLGCESLPGFGCLAAKMSYMSGLRVEAAWSADAGAPGRFEVDYLVPEGAVRGTVLEDAWSAPFEDALPVRRFAARKGQQHLSGSTESA
jgi:hypothetical protein